MAKIIWACDNCGTVLPLWKMKCTNCRRPAVSWLHLVSIAVVVLPALFVLLKFL